MSRRDALLRAVVAVIYLPLYYFVLYPLAFVVGIVLTALSLVIQAVTGREPTLKPRLAASVWDGVSRPVTWIFGGQDRDKPTWVP